MKKLLYVLLAATLLAVTGCTPEGEIRVKAEFTTDRDTYDVGDLVMITNTSTAENAQVAVCRWEIQGEVSYEMDAPEDVSFDEAGEYAIKLIVTADRGAKKSTFEKKITVVDNNIRPVVSFSYLPIAVVAGEPVQFTDSSTDEDGEIVDWIWKFGTTTVEDQNPVFTFGAHGPTEVSLTVIDNKKGKTTKTITIEVGRGANSLDLLWSFPYDNTSDAYVYGTSPAVSADGEYIYVTSTGYALVCFDKQGEQLWSFDLGKNGASALNNSGSIKNQHPTPSVDAEGVVYAAAGFNEPKDTSKDTGLFAINGGASGGSQKWYASIGGGASVRFFAPVITEKYITVIDRNRPSPGKQLQIFNRASGELVADLHANSGSYGGVVGLKNGTFIGASGGAYGSRVYLPTGEGSWVWLSGNTSGYAENLGWKDQPNGSQPAVDANGKVYILYLNKGAYLATTTGSAVLHCYDSKKFVDGTKPVPEWSVALKGECGQYGLGVVVGADGVSYATTYSSSKSYLTAVSATGGILWEHIADGAIQGVAALDNKGFVYYNDMKTGKLVKVKCSDGSRAAEIALGDELRSSPTISSDGVIYVTGMKDDKPTLFAVQGAATGCADSWSQLGGNPSKTGCMY